MNDNIYDNINETLSLIDQLNIPRKFKGDQLYALEFNDVVDKINEIKNHLNGPVHDAMINTTSYILDKINNVQLSLRADTIPINEDSSKTILDELNDINIKLNSSAEKISTNSSNINDILANLDSIGETLGIYGNEINDMKEELNTVDERIENSYNAAVQSSVEQAKEYTDESYTRLYTHINDTTLTFDYDVRTEPTVEQKIIYDNNDDLYDGEYHD